MSQCSSILRALQESGGSWCDMPYLCRISGSLNVHSRAAELRKRGYGIECKITQSKDAQKHSCYRLIESSPVADPMEDQADIANDLARDLFDMLQVQPPKRGSRAWREGRRDQAQF